MLIHNSRIVWKGKNGELLSIKKKDLNALIKIVKSKAENIGGMRVKNINEGTVLRYAAKILKRVKRI